MKDMNSTCKAGQGFSERSVDPERAEGSPDIQRTERSWASASEAPSFLRVTSHQSPVTAVSRLIGSSVHQLKRTLLALTRFLQGALCLHEARCTKHAARVSYAQRLAHKYSQPTRCC